ncbi:MAG: phosphate butyryltransferase [Veillonellaceae bacterium]|nr:phosphate butyryltransferase [Veillonellaceae bacterium]
MLTGFEELRIRARNRGPLPVVVAAAQDEEALRAVKAARDAGMAEPVLVGDETLIRPLLASVGLPADIRLIHEPEPARAALTAAKIVNGTEAGILMKGMVNSSDFLRAVLHPECGLRTDRLLCHLAAFEIPGDKKLVFHTDGGMNVAPTLAEKADIVRSSLLALVDLGIDCPKVAVLAANEVVSPKMPATVDARDLMEMNRRGELGPAIVEGPMAMDVALSREAAAHKGIKSRIAGDVDLFVVPGIEAGNILGKALIHCAGAQSAGVILGAIRPVVMVSRADSAAAKLNSIALACCLAAGSDSPGQTFL